MAAANIYICVNSSFLSSRAIRRGEPSGARRARLTCSNLSDAIYLLSRVLPALPTNRLKPPSSPPSVRDAPFARRAPLLVTDALHTREDRRCAYSASIIFSGR